MNVSASVGQVTVFAWPSDHSSLAIKRYVPVAHNTYQYHHVQIVIPQVEKVAHLGSTNDVVRYVGLNHPRFAGGVQFVSFPKACIAVLIWLIAALRAVLRALPCTHVKRGKIAAAKIPIITITSKSSINVNHLRFLNKFFMFVWMY